MRSEASSDVLKLWLYAVASVLVGAWVSPLVYNAAKALAEVSSAKQTNGPLEWLAGWCGATGFPGYFKASLLVSAVVLFVPFIQGLRGGRSGERALRTVVGGQRLQKNPRGLRQGMTGFLLVAVLFFGIAVTLVFAGMVTWKSPGAAMPMLMVKGLGMALGLAVFQEILFRGIAMGIFLRAMRPAAALGMTAALFAWVHFLNPPPGLNVVDPDASGVGFELLWKIAARFADPAVVLGTFAPLLVLGGVLAYARWRTASLSLPIGLHAGWIFASSLLAEVTITSGHPDTVQRLLSGASPGQGLVPLVGILFAGVLSTFLIRADDAADTRS